MTLFDNTLKQYCVKRMKFLVGCTVSDIYYVSIKNINFSSIIVINNSSCHASPTRNIPAEVSELYLYRHLDKGYLRFSTRIAREPGAHFSNLFQVGAVKES